MGKDTENSQKVFLRWVLIKNCVLLSFALHFISTCKAQPEQVERVYVFKSYQFIAGINASYGYGDDFTMVKNHLQGKQLVKYGWRFGVGATHQFLPTLDFQSMLLFEQKGWKTDIDLSVFGQTFQGEQELTHSTLTYATLVFRPVYRPKKNNHFFVGIGVYGSRLMKGKGVQTISAGGAIISTQTVYGFDNNRTFDFGLTPGIGYEFVKREKVSITLLLSSYIGLVNTVTPDTFSRYNNTYSLSMIVSLRNPTML